MSLEWKRGRWRRVAVDDCACQTFLFRFWSSCAHHFRALLDHTLRPPRSVHTAVRLTDGSRDRYRRDHRQCCRLVLLLINHITARWRHCNISLLTDSSGPAAGRLTGSSWSYENACWICSQYVTPPLGRWFTCSEQEGRNVGGRLHVWKQLFKTFTTLLLSGILTIKRLSQSIKFWRIILIRIFRRLFVALLNVILSRHMRIQILTDLAVAPFWGPKYACKLY